MGPLNAAAVVYVLQGRERTSADFFWVNVPLEPSPFCPVLRGVMAYSQGSTDGQPTGWLTLAGVSMAIGPRGRDAVKGDGWSGTDVLS